MLLKKRTAHLYHFALDTVLSGIRLEANFFWRREHVNELRTELSEN